MEAFKRLLAGFYDVLGGLQAIPVSFIEKLVVLDTYKAPRWALGFAGSGELDSCAEVTGMPSASI